MKKVIYQRKAIPNLPGYEIDSLGAVWSKKSGSLKRLKPYKSDGYAKIDCFINGKRIKRFVHQLVLETFVGERPAGLQVCHNNGNRTDNKLGNLRWDTAKNNVADALQHGTHQGFSFKLNEKQVRVIKWCLRYGMSSAAIARYFPVTRQNINAIAWGKSWQKTVI